MADFILDYEGEHAFLSPDYPCPFTYEGKDYSSIRETFKDYEGEKGEGENYGARSRGILIEAFKVKVSKEKLLATGEEGLFLVDEAHPLYGLILAQAREEIAMREENGLENCLVQSDYLPLGLRFADLEASPLPRRKGEKPKA